MKTDTPDLPETKKVTLSQEQVKRLSNIINLSTLFVIALIYGYSQITDRNIFKEVMVSVIYTFTVYLVAHELIHVLTAFIFEAKRFDYGWKVEKKYLPVVYVHIEGDFTVKHYRYFILAPFIFLNIIPLYFLITTGEWFFPALLFIFNLVSASGDLAILKLSLKIPSQTRIYDLPDEIGFKVLGDGR